MEAWQITLLGAVLTPVLGFASVWVGLRVRRRLGLPTPLDEQIQEQEFKLRKALQDAEARCQADLEEKGRELEATKGELAEERERTEQLRTDLDEAGLRIDRLVQRILRLERANESPGA